MTEGKVHLCIHGKEISVIKNATGDVLWTARYKDISEELGKVDDIMPMWDAKVLFCLIAKLVRNKIAAVDAMTGKLLLGIRKIPGC